MLKYITLAVILLFVIFASYKGLQEETQTPISQSREPEPAAKSTELPTQAVLPDAAKETKSVDVSEEKAPAPEVIESTLADETDDPESEASDEEAPTVKRSQLIGGADVEWIEPEPRPEDDQFGTPPE